MKYLLLRTNHLQRLFVNSVKKFWSWCKSGGVATIKALFYQSDPAPDRGWRTTYAALCCPGVHSDSKAPVLPEKAWEAALYHLHQGETNQKKNCVLWIIYKHQ